MEVEIATVDALNAWDVKEYNPVSNHGVTTKFGNVSTKVGQPRWQFLRYKRP
jgi:hypothetical protein